MIHGAAFVTPHAVRRYQERIDRTATSRRARFEILRLLEHASFDRDMGDGTIQVRARGRRWPGRVRLRLGPGDGDAPAVLTVLPEYDGFRPRRAHQ